MERRLAAIMSADVVGYSRLIRADEEGTITTLKALRADLVDPKLDEHHGRIVKLMGDGMLAEFPSVVDAVRGAVETQMAVAEHNSSLPEDRRIEFRVGINLGDVVIDGDDIHGDGVNVAARLEGMAEPGGICISGSVHEQVRDRTDFAFEDLGEQEVKNIDRPVRVWQWIAETEVQASVLAKKDEPLSLPNKPSIAVLPFDNMSDDTGQEHFADGIAEDVITALSRFRSLFVTARNSSFSYKGTSPDIRTVAGELGVRYVVEGSVRKAGNRVRITAQLIDASSGNHLWGNRFDGALDDVFELQDRITEQIVIAVAPEVEARERELTQRKPPESLDAWELIQRGLTHFYSMDKSNNDEAIRLFRQAVARDPGFAAAYANLAYALFTSLMLGYAEDRQEGMASARVAAETAVSLDANEPLAHFVLGRLLALAGEIEMAIGEAETAIAINPNFAWGHYGLGFVYLTCASVPEKALPHFDAALRLNPRDPLRWAALMLKGSALRILGRYDEAVAVGRQACQFPNVGYMPYMHLSASLAEAGQIIEARAAAEKATERQPAFSISSHRDNFAGANETYLEGLLDSLRKAGVPE